MKRIFVNTPDGVIMAKVEYNHLWSKYQLYIDGSLYGEYDEEEEAEDGMNRSFLEENIIKPDVCLLITNEAPLSSQCEKITGDNYSIQNFDDLFKSTLIKHKKTGLIIRSYTKGEIIRP